MTWDASYFYFGLNQSLAATNEYLYILFNTDPTSTYLGGTGTRNAYNVLNHIIVLPFLADYALYVTSDNTPSLKKWNGI
jgi:hypothetical protein